MSVSPLEICQENLSAPVVVATLETQKGRLIQGFGPGLLVVDEYQMLGDLDRGLNYELALALAPPRHTTRCSSAAVWPIRSMSSNGCNGSDARRFSSAMNAPGSAGRGRCHQLNYHVPAAIRGYWPRLVAKALAEDLGPILVFAPRRQSAEDMAAELARWLPTPNPLSLSAEQKVLAGGKSIANAQKPRGLSSQRFELRGARRGVEPLAKAGQLRVVVATMGLAAGINFSLRSVALAAGIYKRDNREQLPSLG